MTSPSSSIVVVDKSGSVDASNLIQSSQHVHQAHHQPIRAQQVILNEEYLSGDNIVRAGNVNYLIPMPSSASPMIKPTTISQHPNSKVHVISNVTLVSKADQSHSQTINFVNSKHIQTSNASIGGRATVTGGNYVNISAKSQLQNKMFKSPTMTQMDQHQTHIVSAQQQSAQQQQQQQQQQHIITKHLNNASAIVQKVIPRNILVSGRIQNKMEPTTITRTSTPMAQHQANQMGNVIQIQKPNTISINKASSINVNNLKSTKANQQQTIKLVNQTFGGISGSTNTSVAAAAAAAAAQIKHGNASAVKTITSTTINTMSNPITIQPKNQTKTAYSLQSTKIVQQPQGVTIATNANPQSKSQLSSAHSNIIAHSRNNNNNNNNTINANTKLVQHTAQRTVMSMNNMCVQPNVIGQKVITGKNTTASGKYMTQSSPNISNIGQTSCMSTTIPYRSNDPMHGNDQRVTTTYRAIQPSSDTRSTSVTKSITMINHPMHANSENSCQQPPAKKETEWSQFRHRNGVEIGYHEFQGASDTSKKSTTIPTSVDDVIMVNGTHMSEEMSARILQSLSQKVVFHSNNNANNNNNNNNNTSINTSSSSSSSSAATIQPPSRTVQPTQSHRQTQSSNTHRTIQPAPYKAATQPNRSYVEYQNKSGPEYFRVNTSDIQTTTSTFVDNIPLISARGEETYSSTNDIDDDIIGEEVRPKPIDSSMDVRMQALHALLQDHTYVQWPVDKQAQLTSSTVSITSSTSANAAGTAVLNSAPCIHPEPSQSNVISPSNNKTKQSATSHSSENVSVVPNVSVVVNQTTSPNALANKYQQSSSAAPLIPGFPLGYSAMMNKDDDANSAISNGSNKSDIDPGEETETAPEAGNEDDSVTRCICELTHDDGYMICCDKCSVWQHVDCMGIDRQNIPEEYKCELCQPREIDQNRARTLQLMKRKEQQNFLIMKQSNQVSGFPADSTSPQATSTGDRSQLNTFSTILANKKKGTLSSKSRKGDLFGASNSKRKRNDSIRASKRRESKKALSKRKSHSSSNSSATTPVKPNPTTPGESGEKQPSNLRQWIENYEIAMTNHYSPELRARLQSIVKQMSSSTATLPTLKNASSLDNKCTTVPHAGAKILISTREIAPSNPVIEIRGKYMLSSQFKPAQQPPSSSPTSANGTRNFSKMNPGPFLFFYRMPNDGPEICVDTRTYGNEARFVRRSCRPNAEIVHSIEKGTPHLYIVSLNTIRSSTEITIKHESHDLEALERGEISAPTSTICGCGLIKDCLFGANNSNASTPQPSTPTSSKKLKKPNGHIKDKFSSYRKRSKLEKAKQNQTDAASSSSTGVLSPTVPKATSADDSDGAKLGENVPAKSSHEKTPKETEKTHDKPHRKNNNSIDSLWTADQKTDQTHASGNTKNVETSKSKEEPTIQTTPLSPNKSNHDSSKFDGQSRTMKSPPTTPVSGGSMKSPSAKSSHKKSARKSTHSFSEDTGDEYSASTSKDKDAPKTESKKLTREERKMEAIVRAFEKMEKSAQRKNEQNKHKSTSSTTHSASIMSNKKRNSSFTKDDGDKVKKSNSQSGKRKRKRGKSYSQSSSQKRRRNRYDSHNSDDGNTSDESSTPMMSPTRLHDLDRHQRTPNESRDSKGHSDNLAAGLLLSLSNYGANRNADKNNCLSSPERYNTGMHKSQSNTPPFAVSSACLLIEAAVGPLDNDFKLPTKTKTKKTIMNDWLHQSDGTASSYQSQNQDNHRLLSPSTSMDNYSHIDSNTNSSYSHEEPRNLSIAAQKIEEFIHLTSGEHMDDDECSKWSGSPLCQSSDAMTVPTPLPTPPLQMGSSVKKRWLRQAISEECSDDLLGNSATSSPPNGFMAPLKKRRVVRQCSDLNAEDVSSPKEDIKELVTEEDTAESMSKEDIVKVCQDGEEAKTWQDVDIKIETETEMESESKEPKDKVDVEPKPSQTVENRMILDDVDKFEPIESDEDDVLCDRLDIKTEIETTEDKSMEAYTYKQEPISEDSKSQDNADTQSSMDDTRPLASDADFDLDDSKSDSKLLNRTEVSLLSNVLPKNEIEDIQQKLHSFHSENLMILQTRNKKRASRATTPTSDDIPSNSNTSKDSFLAASSSEFVLKSRRFSEDEISDFKQEPPMKIQMNEDESAYSHYQTDPILQPNPVALAQTIASGHSYPYMNRVEPNQNVSSITQMYQTAPPPPPPPSNFPNSALGGNIGNIQPSNSLYHYLENPSRTPGYNTGYNAPHMFTMNTSVPPPTLLNSSNYLTKSYTTLSEPSTPVTNIPAPSPIGVAPSASTSASATAAAAASSSSTTGAAINPKVLTRTQSADPRLNPPKDLPPVTPKRKLSINEYMRRRKQLTTSTEKSKVETIDKIETPAESTKDLIIDDKPKNGMAAVADTTKDTVFSPAPTLLELQQESLSRRLKSYKTLHELSTGIEPPIKSTDSTLENEISTSISEALHASSSNSSLTSVSSPKSDRDFDDAEIDINDPIRSSDVNKDEPSTSDGKSSSSHQADLYEEKIEPSENDFDLEPAEPTELTGSTEPTERSTESTSQNENIETSETSTMPCDD